MTDLLNALVLLSNFLFIPALSYGSQLALGALGVTLIFGILRFFYVDMVLNDSKLGALQ